MPNEVVKSPTIYGVTGKLETSYGAGGSPSTSTDGLQLAEVPKLTLGYAFDGTRNAPPGTTGYQKRAKPNGRTGTVPLKSEFKGPGAAYSASVFSALHILARTAGFNAALTTTTGSEKYVYTPTPGPLGYASGVFDLFAMGEKYPLFAAYADLEIAGDDTGVVYVTANVQGLVGAVVDQLTPPAITYPYADVLPPTSCGASLFSLGDFTDALLRKCSFKMGRTISPRSNQNTAAGHNGFAVGRRTPTLEVTFETPALVNTPFHSAGGIDPYNLYDSAAELPAQIAIGADKYNRLTIAVPKAQVMTPPAPPTDEGDVVVTTLQFQLNPSAANANDEVSLTTD